MVPTCLSVTLTHVIFRTLRVKQGTQKRVVITLEDVSRGSHRRQVVPKSGKYTYST